MSASVSKRFHRPHALAAVLALAVPTMGEGVAMAETVETTDVAQEIGLGDNPYRAIIARNAFRLKDPLPPPPPPTNAPPPPEVPKIDVKLAGVGEISGVRYAYLMVPDPDRQGQFLYPTLTDNPSRGRVRHSTGVEIREIDVRGQSVRMMNGGIEVTLTLQDNGVKGTPAPAATTAGKPGGVPAPRVVGTRPTVVRPPTTTAAAANAAAGGDNMAAPLVFSRNPNRASVNNSFTPGGPVAGVPITGSDASGNLPTRPLRTTPSPAVPQRDIPLAEQYEILVRQRAAADAMGVPLPPIPGLPLPTDPQPGPPTE